ncbi:EcsC family protein [Maribius pontilimi]|uniref:EcsC family protein n=1 Tax=Palleronia pontilimi TaxID=1964209 RepID=A0A934IBT0_9RHOB|nr:EcsC family protein [Palleronia pontilimi]MBJ3762756.1 EcsC family protein [Palleronia pontilimi]
MSETSGTDIPVTTDQIAPEIAAELEALARRSKNARGIVMRGLGLVGSQLEHQLEKLPVSVRMQIEGATRQGLEYASRVAWASRRSVPDRPDWQNTAMTAAMGAAGGVGGLPTALAELPVTITMLLRAIQGVATDLGFDTDTPLVQAQCIKVFSASGPLSDDDGADLAFLSSRVTLSGAAVHGIIARVAPKLATVLSQKLATQAVPVLGAMAGAATNYAFTSYYQEMARVYFGLRALARDEDIPFEVLMQEFRLKMQPPKQIG